MPQKTRIEREAETLSAMIAIYCHETHDTRGMICAYCQKIKDYALLRLSRCPYQNAKTTCVQCPTHCYQPQFRQSIRQIMRVAGPRMIWKHPLLALQHLLDGILHNKPGLQKPGFKQDNL